MQTARIGRYGKPVTKRALAEHLRELGQKQQMLFGRVLGNEQDEDLSDRLAVGRVERDWLARPYECAQRVREALDASVGNCDALPETGRAELFSREQAVENDRARDLRVVFEKLADLLEKPLLARGLEIEQDVRFGKELRDLVHAGAHTSGARPQKDDRRSGSDSAGRRDSARRARI